MNEIRDLKNEDMPAFPSVKEKEELTVATSGVEVAKFRSSLFGGYSKKDVDGYVGRLQKMLVDVQEEAIHFENENGVLFDKMKEAEGYYTALWEKSQGQAKVISVQKKTLDSQVGIIRLADDKVRKQKLTIQDYEEAILEQAQIIEACVREIEDLKQQIQELQGASEVSSRNCE